MGINAPADDDDGGIVAGGVDPDIEAILGDLEAPVLDEPAPPPQAPAPRVIADASDRVHFPVAGGQIVFHKTRKDFYAECPVRGDDVGQHGKLCRKCRTSKASGGRKSAQGRPLGLLVSWLQKAHEHASADSHKVLCRSSFAERKAARQFRKSLPGSSALLDHERPVQAGEDSEPEQEP